MYNLNKFLSASISHLSLLPIPPREYPFLKTVSRPKTNKKAEFFWYFHFVKFKILPVFLLFLPPFLPFYFSFARKGDILNLNSLLPEDPKKKKIKNKTKEKSLLPANKARGSLFHNLY